MNFLKEKSIYFILLLTFLFFIQGVVQLPVMDRDEARFSTASKTMLETKNFVDIKMQDEVRYKKPVGIYWLQSISNYFFGNPPYDEIWVYRLPSLIGVILAIFLIYRLKNILGTKTGFEETNVNKNGYAPMGYAPTFWELHHGVCAGPLPIIQPKMKQKC